MRALFPCGSITGAPKVRTMAIIREVEPFPRGVYTGALGYVEPGGNCTLNVAIRTVLVDTATGGATFGVGGGITVDSTAAGEYDECVLKSRFLTHARVPFRLLESVLLESGEFFLLDRHLTRLSTSARYFRFACDLGEVRRCLQRVREQRPQGAWKVRLLVGQDGKVWTEEQEIPTRGTTAPRRVALAAEPVDSRDVFLFHKTTNRAVYDRALAAVQSTDDVILWNEKGEVTESCTANLVIEVAGRKYTPPVECGLLAGTFRAQLIDDGVVAERVIRREELRQADAVFLVNSVRRWIPVVWAEAG